MPADIGDFLALESEVWRALVDGDAAADERLLSDDFLGVYPSGFATRSDHVGQLDTVPSVASFELSDARLIRIGDDSALLSYQADFTRCSTPDEPDGTTHRWYVSSLWTCRAGRWVNVFSQDTPAA